MATAHTSETTATRELPINEVRYLSPEETVEFFDAQARKLLGISGDEFLRRWDAGNTTMRTIQ